jgi:alpha-tubulin suppressor-like RCC1 family protein
MDTKSLARFCLAILAVCSPAQAVEPAGLVVGWGDTGNLQTSDTPLYSQPGGPVLISEGILTNTVALSASQFYSLALKADGTVFGWGSNHRGQAIGYPTPDPYTTNGLVTLGGEVLRGVVAVEAGNGFSLALKKNGTVAVWGSGYEGATAVPPGLSNVTAIAAGEFHGLALKTDGTVACWGGRKGVFAGLSNVVCIAAAKSWFWHDVALKSDGSIIEQHPTEQQIVLVDTNVVAISAGYNHSLALKRDGTVFGWGSNNEGQATGVQTNRGPSNPGVSSGLVKLNGRVLSNVVAVSAGHEYSLALKQDGTVLAWGNKRFYQAVPAGLSNVVAIAAGEGFGLAITTNRNALTRKW